MNSYQEAHLVLAAVRLLEARAKVPPVVEEIANLLQWHGDHAGVVVRQLEGMGALRALKSPFETRYEVADHLKVEEIDREDDGAGFADELAEFEQKTAEEQEKLAEMFETGKAEAARKAKIQGLDDDFSRFKRQKPKDPFGD